MPIMTSQQINNYFDQFKDSEITFTKEVIRATGLKPKLVFLKSAGYHIPCIIYSVSMTSAKVIANISSDMYEQIRNSNNLASLRFAFHENDKIDPLMFFVSARVTGYNPYNSEKPSLNFISIEFTQRPPDDLIAILGQIFEAKAISQKRKEERIVINADSVKKLGIKNKSANVYIQGVPRTCIIRDLSFSGAKVILAGVAKFLLNKEAIVHIDTIEKGQIEIHGKIVRNEEVEGRKDLVAIAIFFEEKETPIEYKMILNDYFKQKKYKPSN